DHTKTGTKLIGAGDCLALGSSYRRLSGLDPAVGSIHLGPVRGGLGVTGPQRIEPSQATVCCSPDNGASACAKDGEIVARNHQSKHCVAVRDPGDLALVIALTKGNL